MIDSSMHVAIITPAYPPLPGGGERYVGALTRGLAAAGVRVSVITGAATVESDFWNGAAAVPAGNDAFPVARLAIEPFPGGRRRLLLYRKAMVLLSALPGDQSPLLMRMAGLVPPIAGMEDALAALADVDLVHAFNISWEHALVAAHAYARRIGAPLIVTPFLHLGERANGRVARNSTMDHQLRIMREADQLLTLTRVESEGLGRYYIPPERVDVIGGGVDLPPEDFAASPYFADDHPEARGEFGVYIGRLSYDKGALHAADAVRSLRRRGRDIALLLIGSSTPEFERYRRRLSPEDRAAIRPLGILSDRDKHAVLSRALFLMLPSRSDSFGIVLLEAWTHGVPVIAARAGGIPGVVDDGANGLLVSFADVDGLANAIDRIAGDELFAQRLGRQGQEKVNASYNWDVVVERVVGHYRRLLESRRAGS